MSDNILESLGVSSENTRKGHCRTILLILVLNGALLLFWTMYVNESSLMSKIYYPKYNKYHLNRTISIYKINNGSMNPTMNFTRQRTATSRNTTYSNNHTLKLYVEAQGRFGNVLFELAAVYGLSKRSKRTAILLAPHDFIFLKRVFPHLNVQIQPTKYSPTSKLQTKTEVRLQYTPSLLSDLPNSDVKMCCFLQSFKYFDNEEDDIRKMFQFADVIQGKVHHKLMNIRKTLNVDRTVSVVYIGIQMRRGDLASKNSYKMGYRIPKPTYIRKTMEYYKHKYHDSITVFIVSSDDIKWCKKNINFPDTHFVHDSYEIDMATLAACNHSIITTGTFSWWSGYLAGGEVIYYKDQFAKDSIMGVAVLEDRFPPAWIPMTD